MIYPTSSDNIHLLHQGKKTYKDDEMETLLSKPLNPCETDPAINVLWLSNVSLILFFFGMT